MALGSLAPHLTCYFYFGDVSRGIFLLLIDCKGIIRASGMTQQNVGSDLKREELGKRGIGVLHHNVRLWTRMSPQCAALTWQLAHQRP